MSENGVRCRTLRIQLGMSQKELARRLHVPVYEVVRFEKTSEARIPQLMQIPRILAEAYEELKGIR